MSEWVWCQRASFTWKESAIDKQVTALSRICYEMVSLENKVTPVRKIKYKYIWPTSVLNKE